MNGQGPRPGSTQSGRRATCHVRGAVRQHEVADTLYSARASVPMVMVTQLYFSPLNTSQTANQALPNKTTLSNSQPNNFLKLLSYLLYKNLSLSSWFSDGQFELIN